MPWSGVESRVQAFLHDTENDPMPMGIHTAGELPPEAVQREALQDFIKYGFEDSEAKQFAGEPKVWAEAIFEGRQPEVSAQYPAALREKIQAALVPGLGNQELRDFGRRLARATRWSPAAFSAAPAALRAGMIQGLPPAHAAGAAPRPATFAPRPAARHYVSGYQMRERVLQLGGQTPLPKLIPLGYLLAIASLIAFGAVRELLSRPSP
jgi:hypothetical protein